MWQQTGRQRSPRPTHTESGATARPSLPSKGDARTQSRSSSREHFQTLFKAVGLESLTPFLVVIGIVGVQPIAFRIDVQVCDFRQFRRLDQKLLFGDETGNQVDFFFVQVKLAAVELTVQRGICEEDFRGAAFDDDVENLRALQFVKGLRRKDHGGVVLAPGLQSLDDILLNTGILQEDPRFIEEENFEHGGNLPIGDERVRAVQDVEEQRFQKFRILTHALKVEGLEAGKRNGVFGVVEQESELAAASPFGEATGEVMAQGIGEHTQGAQRRVHGIQILDLLEEVALGCWLELAAPGSLHQNPHEQGKEIQIFLGRRQRKRIDLAIFPLQAHAHIGSLEKPRETFKAPTQIKNERVRRVFLQVGDQEVQEKAFPGARAPENHGMGHIAVVKIQKVGRVVVGLEHREIFLAQVGILRLATIQGEQQREISIVRV